MYLQLITEQHTAPFERAILFVYAFCLLTDFSHAIFTQIKKKQKKVYNLYE